MANVIVDPQKLRDTANQITQYVEIHKNGMWSIDNAVQGLRSSEVGEEFDLLQQKWNLTYGNGSTSKEMLDMLERYAAFLNSCARNYETAQKNAGIRASRI